MPAAQRSIVIDRPVDEVWAFIADGSTAPRWRSGVLDVAHVSGRGVGEVWKQGVKGPGGRRIDADYEITAFEPGRLLAFKAIAGPVRPTGEYRLAAETGGTRLSFSLAVELGGWKKLLMGGAVQATMDAEMAALDRLKAILEA
ncbi:MAG: SRPBCC family protein [Chloroflexi bacterium]|nr:SRPBCC family protein [Chloroflexota bacterium]